MLRSKLKSWLGWQPQPAEFLALMRPVKPWPVQMDLFTRGIDNTHIDIYLSSRFVACSQAMVEAMIGYDVASNYWNQSAPQPTPEILEEFRLSYRGMLEGAMKQRQQVPPADWVRLVQLSLLKFLLQLVPEEIQRLRQLQEALRDDEQSLESGRRLEIHERLVLLAREEDAISYRVYQRLFKLVDKLETVNLRKLRKSLLGISWPLPREALFNALLQLPNPHAEGEVMRHYPMLFIEENRRDTLDGINRCVADVFHDYLPTWAHPGRRDGNLDETTEQGPGFRVMERFDQGGLQGFLETEIILSQLLCEDEYKQPQYSWLDEPDNLLQLLDSTRMPGEGRGDERSARQWGQFKRAACGALEQGIERLGVMPQVIASYWTPRIYQELNAKVPARLIYDYLTGRQTKRKVLRRLSPTQSGVEPSVVAKTLDFAASEIKQLTGDSRREYAHRILKDFLCLRRDLKLAYKTFEAMDQVRILRDQDEINLSRANGLLYEFRLPEEQSAEKRIRSHVILKADLRGSTRITAELRAKKLNPATHFSQNFFNPINKHLDNFGAKKVFVEGDAVILSFLEKSGSAQRDLSVAHACGLGARILDVVARQNTLNRRHGLPDLELGLGIAYCNEEPTYLYDESKQIMISPAINLADRLSSCSKGLRESSFFKKDRAFRVEVLVPEDDSDALAGAKTNVLRYNVNGIELDLAGFNKLKTEVVLHRFDFRVAGRSERFHVGRYPDGAGRMQWLVVRESPLRRWLAGSVSEITVPGRWFYEVIVDAGLITLIRSKLRAARDQAGESNRPRVGR